MRLASSAAPFLPLASYIPGEDFSSDDINWKPSKTELGTADYATFTARNLLPSTTYEFQIFAGNQFGEVRSHFFVVVDYSFDLLSISIFPCVNGKRYCY
jgi:hypothetical protein